MKDKFWFIAFVGMFIAALGSTILYRMSENDNKTKTFEAQYLRNQLKDINEAWCEMNKSHYKRTQELLKKVEQNGGGEFVPHYKAMPNRKGTLIFSNDSRDTSLFLLYDKGGDKR